MLSSTPLGGLLARIAEMVQPRVTTRLLLTYDDPDIREPAQGSASSLSSDAALSHYSFTIRNRQPHKSRRKSILDARGTRCVG